MSLPLTATDAKGRTFTVVWQQQSETVTISVGNFRGDGRVTVELDPGDAIEMAAHLLSAGIAARIHVDGEL